MMREEPTAYLFGTITSYEDSEISIEYLDLPLSVMNDVWELVGPYCTSSVKGTPEQIAEEVARI